MDVDDAAVTDAQLPQGARDIFEGYQRSVRNAPACHCAPPFAFNWIASIDPNFGSAPVLT